MTNKDFKEGMAISCEINGTKIDDAKLHLEDDNWYICHNVEDEDESYYLEDSLGYKCNFNICDDWAEGEYDVTNIQPKHRTIDDLECGDYVVGKYGKKLCLAICGKLYGMSYNNDFETLEGWFTLKNLMEMEYTLYQPTEEKETDIDKCIKVIEGYFEHGNSVIRNEIVQALKNLKK